VQQEEERRKEERAKLQLAIKQEKAKIRALHRAALNCTRAAQIRHLISTARDSAIGNGQQVQAGTAFGDWLIWRSARLTGLIRSRKSGIDPRSLR
jgi:hypothetical protein